MTKPDETSSARPRRPGAPALVLTIALTLTAIATAYVAWSTRREARLRFNGLVQQTNDSIAKRIGTYISLLSGASGLFAAKNDSVGLSDFQAYVNRLGAPLRGPGMRGIGFAARVDPPNEAALVAQMRRQGRKSFHLWPPEPGKTERLAVVYLEPHDIGNQSGLGMDLGFEPTRRAALDLACATGEAAATARIRPARNPAAKDRAAFLIVLPVFSGGAAPSRPEDRRARLIGFVYCPFWADDLLENTVKTAAAKRLDVTVYDGDTLTPDHVLDNWRASPSDTARPGDLTGESHLLIAGRTWTVQYRANLNFDEGEVNLAPYVLIAGSAISALLFGISRAQVRARTEAERLVLSLRRSDEALRQTETRARQLIESNIIGVLRGRFSGPVLEANDAFLQISGYTRDEVQSGAVTMAALTPPEIARNVERALQRLQRTGSLAPIETSVVRRDGARVPVLLGATRRDAFAAPSEPGQAENAPSDEFIAFVLDITERKDAEQRLRENETRQRSFFRDVLASVTEGKLRLCDERNDLPPRWPEAVTPPILLTRPTLRTVRQAARGAAALAGMTEDRLQDLLTAVGESSMNAVMHAGGGTAYVAAREGSVQVWVEDNGSGIDMQRLPQATLERGFTTAGSLGHGFWLMLKTIDRLWLLTGPSGTTIVLEQDAVPIEPLWLRANKTP